MRYEISKSFLFDAAHHLGMNVDDPDHIYATLHGHSFEVEVTLAGEPGATTGWVQDFGALDAALAGIRVALDHKFLNKIEGLEQPTLERIALWIWNRLLPDLPDLVRVRIYRGSGRESCTLTAG